MKHPVPMPNSVSNFDFAEEFRQRTKAFALRIMKLVDRLPSAPSCRAAGLQLVRAGTSIAANYRAACRARSEREFNAKLHIALEEADETVLWLELLSEGGHLPAGRIDDLLTEAKAIMSVLGKAEKTARDKVRRASNTGN
ncbi:four helix bundle protein [Hymenobacter edaphi]|nr:four helix bundle protein [Hymenobacter edaphi]